MSSCCFRFLSTPPLLPMADLWPWLNPAVSCPSQKNFLFSTLRLLGSISRTSHICAHTHNVHVLVLKYTMGCFCVPYNFKYSFLMVYLGEKNRGIYSETVKIKDSKLNEKSLFSFYIFSIVYFYHTKIFLYFWEFFYSEKCEKRWLEEGHRRSQEQLVLKSSTKYPLYSHQNSLPPLICIILINPACTREQCVKKNVKKKKHPLKRESASSRLWPTKISRDSIEKCQI